MRRTEKKKMSFDIEMSNLKWLKETADSAGVKVAPMLNSLIKIFAGSPSDFRHKEYVYCCNRVIQLQNEIEIITGSYERRKVEDEISWYVELGKLYSGNMNLTAEEMSMLDKDKISLKEGYAVIPDDWIVLNRNQAPDKMYACVVEFRNWEKFDIPHFVYFTDTEMGRDYDTKEINRLCNELWPQFNDMLAKQVKPRRDPTDNHIVNSSEWSASPHVGYFPLEVYESKEELAKDHPPFGAYILRDTSGEK